MTREEGFKKIRALLGKDCRIDVNEQRSSPEDRAREAERERELKAERDAVQAEIARLEASVGIPELRKRSAALHKEEERARWGKHYCRIQTYTPSGGIGWVVRESGDGFSEVITKINERLAQKDGEK